MVGMIMMQVFDCATPGLVTRKIHAAAVLHFRLRTSCAFDWSGVRITWRTGTNRLSIVLVLHWCCRMSATTHWRPCEKRQIHYWTNSRTFNLRESSIDNYRFLAPGSIAWRRFGSSFELLEELLDPPDSVASRCAFQLPSSYSRRACGICCKKKSAFN